MVLACYGCNHKNAVRWDEFGMVEFVAVPALEACAEYDHWAREVRRLSAEISACECPNQYLTFDADTGDSCFKLASLEEFPGREPEDGPTRRNLAAIAQAVQDCPSCLRLVMLIADRAQARQRWGIAKRKVRHYGRRATTSTNSISSSPSVHEGDDVK